MPKAESSESKSNGSALSYEAQLWAAAEQAVPAFSTANDAPRSREGEMSFAHRISSSASDGEKVAKPDEVFPGSGEGGQRSGEGFVADRVRDVGGKPTFAERVGVRPASSRHFCYIQNLRRTRDLLLARLLSGQVELKMEAA